MPFFLGIDGGGTKTRCVVGDEKLQLGAGSSSSSKVQRVGEACARSALAGAVNEACVQAGISPRQIARTCAGITGAARSEIAGVMRDLMSGIVGALQIIDMCRAAGKKLMIGCMLETSLGIAAAMQIAAESKRAVIPRVKDGAPLDCVAD